MDTADLIDAGVKYAAAINEASDSPEEATLEWATNRLGLEDPEKMAAIVPHMPQPKKAIFFAGMQAAVILIEAQNKGKE